tara:strand:- start:2719 stop:3399 length:681 start_codon:yes stop_codon:yes gene_type:complete
MATVYANTQDGYVARHNQSSWANARANSSGTAGSSTGSGHYIGISASQTPARGGGVVYNIYRSFMYFDTSGISTNIDSATLKIRGFSSTSGDLIAVKATSNISTLGYSDFEEIEGWDSSGTDGSGGGDMESSVTKYSDEITTWTASGYNDITLNAQAKADMRDNGAIYIALINFDYDLKDVEPTGYSDNRNGLYYVNYKATSRDPYIDYELATVTTDNSVFFGTNF